MSGTKQGSRKTALTNKRKYGEDFYSRIGRLGGSVHNPLKGFGSHRELASIVGAKGGYKSRRTAKSNVGSKDDE